jgi:rod shape-determining protein MreC
MTEKRTRLLLVALVLGQLLLISAQVPTVEGHHSLLAGTWLRGVAPFAAAVDAVTDGIARFAVYWTTRRRLLAENERLRIENEALRQRAVRNLGTIGDLQRLSAAVDYARASGMTVRLADVVFSDHASWMRTFLLRLGSGEVSLNQPVITNDGLVGRIVGLSGHYAKAQLVTDRAASVGVMVERTRRQGVARGASADSLKLQFIPLQADLEVGDRVVTAGIDGVYPRGILVGTVVRVEPGSELFYEVELAPAVDFRSVDHVYILDREILPEDLQDPAAEPSGATP